MCCHISPEYCLYLFSAATVILNPDHFYVSWVHLLLRLPLRLVPAVALIRHSLVCLLRSKCVTKMSYHVSLNTAGILNIHLR